MLLYWCLVLCVLFFFFIDPLFLRLGENDFGSASPALAAAVGLVGSVEQQDPALRHRHGKDERALLANAVYYKGDIYRKGIHSLV